jgi:hypothetical protein
MSASSSTSLPRLPAVYCAIADSAYFLGAVALVNSLRLKGHDGEIAFLDVGLDDDQRAFLEQEATIHPGPPGSGWLSVFAKPMLGLLNPNRVVVFLDNDLLITGSLEPLVRAAQEGEIAVFDEPDPTRWFPEWQELFSLRQPLRRGQYANGACLALSTDRWRGFLERWYELGESVADERAKRPFLLRRQEVLADPVGYNEQDTLNALLMSEVPEGVVRSWSHNLAPHWSDRGDVRLVDSRTLHCTVGGEPTLFLHSTGQPKPWQPKGWLRLRFPAFNRLLVRVLTAEDVALRVSSAQIPRWLRAGPGGRVPEYAGATVARLAYGSVALVPSALRTRLTAAGRARLSGTGPRGGDLGDPAR